MTRSRTRSSSRTGSKRERSTDSTPSTDQAHRDRSAQDGLLAGLNFMERCNQTPVKGRLEKNEGGFFNQQQTEKRIDGEEEEDAVEHGGQKDTSGCSDATPPAESSVPKERESAKKAPKAKRTGTKKRDSTSGRARGKKQPAEDSVGGCAPTSLQQWVQKGGGNSQSLRNGDISPRQDNTQEVVQVVGSKPASIDLLDAADSPKMTPSKATTAAAAPVEAVRPNPVETTPCDDDDDVVVVVDETKPVKTTLNYTKQEAKRQAQMIERRRDLQQHSILKMHCAMPCQIANISQFTKHELMPPLASIACETVSVLTALLVSSAAPEILGPITRTPSLNYLMYMAVWLHEFSSPLWGYVPGAKSYPSAADLNTTLDLHEHFHTKLVPEAFEVVFFNQPDRVGQLVRDCCVDHYHDAQPTGSGAPVTPRGSASETRPVGYLAVAGEAAVAFVVPQLNPLAIVFIDSHGCLPTLSGKFGVTYFKPTGSQTEEHLMVYFTEYLCAVLDFYRKYEGAYGRCPAMPGSEKSFRQGSAKDYISFVPITHNTRYAEIAAAAAVVEEQGRAKKPTTPPAVGSEGSAGSSRIPRIPSCFREMSDAFDALDSLLAPVKDKLRKQGRKTDGEGRGSLRPRWI